MKKKEEKSILDDISNDGCLNTIGAVLLFLFFPIILGFIVLAIIKFIVG